jgi:hypothetical protein
MEWSAFVAEASSIDVPYWSASRRPSGADEELAAARTLSRNEI